MVNHRSPKPELQVRFLPLLRFFNAPGRNRIAWFLRPRPGTQRSWVAEGSAGTRECDGPPSDRGASVNGKPPVSKTGTAGSIPAAPVLLSLS